MGRCTSKIFLLRGGFAFMCVGFRGGGLVRGMN